jgi:integrase
MVRHQAALASGKLTRVTSGVNLPPLEVIMSSLEREHNERDRKISAEEFDRLYQAAANWLKPMLLLD